MSYIHHIFDFIIFPFYAQYFQRFIYISQNEILNSTVRLCGGIYSNTVDIYYFI